MTTNSVENHCLACGVVIPPHPGPGRKREYCGGTCKNLGWLARRLEPEAYNRIRAHHNMTVIK